MNYIWWWAHCQRIFQTHKCRMEGTFHREEYWERVGPSSRAFNPQKMVTRYFHQNKPRKLYWKYFVSRHVSPASSNSCRDSIVVIVVLSARVPGQALLIELKGDFYHHFNLQDIHLDDSLRNASVRLLRGNKICLITSLPLRNINITDAFNE